MVRVAWSSRVSRARRCHRVGADLLLMRATEHDKALGCEWRVDGTTLTTPSTWSLRRVRSGVQRQFQSFAYAIDINGKNCCDVHHEVGKRARTGESAGTTNMQPARWRCCGESTKYTIEHCWHVVAADCTSGQVRVTAVHVVQVLQLLIWYMLCAKRKRPQNSSCRQLRAHGDSHKSSGQMTIVQNTVICGRDDAKLAETDILESMDVCEEVFEDAFNPHDDAISCRCVVAE